MRVQLLAIGSKYARKAKDKLHKPSERASEICEQTLHRQEQNRMCIASMRESGDSESTHKYNHMHCCAKGLALQCLSLVIQSSCFAVANVT